MVVNIDSISMTYIFLKFLNSGKSDDPASNTKNKFMPMLFYFFGILLKNGGHQAN